MTWPFEGLTPMKYGAVLADPPWHTELRSDAGYGKSPEAHYGTMSLDDMKALPVRDLAGADCYLFLWAVWPQVPQALELMEAWGFRYVTGGSWTKRTVNWKVTFGTGYVLRSSTEPFFVGKIGEPERKSRSERTLIDAPVDVLAAEAIPDGIEAIRREHSRKPPEMREMIGRLLPRAFCAELFAREPWPGNDVWGNQADKFEVAA